MRRRIVKWTIIALIASVISGTAAFYYMRVYAPEKINFDLLTNQKEKEQVEEEEVPYPDWQERERVRALAVVMDNTESARPQSGLEYAETVLELPVEGGLTRLLAIIATDDIITVGPIRSIRPYIVDLAKEYNGVIVHAGGSQQALEQVEDNKVEHLDEIYGKNLVSAAFWRLPDRQKPHNLYASIDSLRKVCGELKYNLTEPPRQRPTLLSDEEVNGEDAEDITIYYPNRKSVVQYLYDKEEKIFIRHMADKPHESEQGKHLTTPNIIIQYVSYRYLDGDGRIQLIMHGKGEALIFREGKVVSGVWQKEPGGFTKFVDRQGKEIPLLDGPVWIQVVLKGMRVDY